MSAPQPKNIELLTAKTYRHMWRGDNERTENLVRKGVDVLSVSSGPFVSKINKSFKRSWQFTLHNYMWGNRYQTTIKTFIWNLSDVWKFKFWFLNFLIWQNTDGSAREQTGLAIMKALYAQHVEQFVNKMDCVHRIGEPKIKSNSFKSAKSSSKSSSVASLLGRQRAKREAAKMKLMFAEQEVIY